MTASTTHCRRPFFLQRGARRLFAIHHPPADGQPPRGGAVFFAPFGEEMNRSRRMASLLAEALASAGIGTLVFDYACTGDSDGRFGEASLDAWVEDGTAAIEWLAGTIDGPVVPVGLRLGAIVALRSAGQATRRIGRAVLWQPVISGQTMLTQFLRIRIAASMSERAERETTASLRQRLSGGDALEIGGYVLPPGLARALDEARLAACVPPPGTRIDWLEVAAEPSDSLLAPGEPVVAAWRAAGVEIAAATVAGEQFWTTQEIATAPALIAATVRALAGATA